MVSGFSTPAPSEMSWSWRRWNLAALSIRSTRMSILRTGTVENMYGAANYTLANNNDRRITMKFRLMLALVSALFVTTSIHAQPPGWYRHPAGQHVQPGAGPAEQASATLRQGIDKMQEFLGQEEEPNRLQTAAFLDREIAPYFDFDYMAQWVAGPAYARMDGKAKEALAAKLEASFLGTLAKQLASYEGQRLRLLKPRRGSRGSVNVRVAVLRPGSYPGKLEFRMYQSTDGWKVYDVYANGRSVSSYYRQQFRRSAPSRADGAPR